LDRRSIIFGLGVGIVIVAFVFFVATRFISAEPEIVMSAADVSDEEIIERARVLGMVTIRELPESADEPGELARHSQELETLLSLMMERNLELLLLINELEPALENADDILPNENSEDEPAIVSDLEGYHQITIPRGLNSIDIAVLFFTNGIVESAMDFNNFVITNEMTTRLIEGTYNIPEGSSFAEILSIISIWES